MINSLLLMSFMMTKIHKVLKLTPIMLVKKKPKANRKRKKPKAKNNSRRKR